MTELTCEDEVALEEIYRVMRMVEGPEYDATLDTDDFEILDVAGIEPARIYRFGTHYLELHPEGVVEGSLKGGLIYWRSITRAGEVANTRVTSQTERPEN